MFRPWPRSMNWPVSASRWSCKHIGILDRTFCIQASCSSFHRHHEVTAIIRSSDFPSGRIFENQICGWGSPAQTLYVSLTLISIPVYCRWWSIFRPACNTNGHKNRTRIDLHIEREHGHARTHFVTSFQWSRFVSFIFSNLHTNFGTM